MAQTDFKRRLNEAVKLLKSEHKLLDPRNNNLCSLHKVHGAYRWQLVQNADGLLLVERFAKHQDKKNRRETRVVAGIIIQSEYTTSGTKPNPQGKAAIVSVLTGLWFEEQGSEGMTRIDIAEVLFVLPAGASASDRKRFATTLENVRQAVSLHGRSRLLIVGKVWSRKKLAKRLYAQVQDVLTSVGRPKTSD